MKESSKINDFKNLSDFDIIKLLTENTQKEISKRFKVPASFISKEITERNLFEVMNNDKKRRLIPYKLKRDMFSENEFDYGFGEWKESDIRKSNEQYYKICK